MQYEVYRQIIDEIQSRLGKDVLDLVKTRFPSIRDATLRSIISQEYQRKVKKSHFKHNTDEAAAFYHKSYQAMWKTATRPGSLLALSEKHDVSPALMARIVLQQHCTTNGETLTKQQISKLLKDSSRIQDKHLSIDVHLCVLNDDNYGPYADAIKHSIGHQYEFKLKKHLSELKIPYLEEDNLRAEGYDKTPDVKLQIPIAVKGKVINWIESKASFGDPENHRNYLKEQLWSYWNRFGPGLVIYWFGFVDEMDEHREKGILISDHFPTEITFMDPDKLSQEFLDLPFTTPES